MHYHRVQTLENLILAIFKVGTGQQLIHQMIFSPFNTYDRATSRK